MNNYNLDARLVEPVDFVPLIGIGTSINRFQNYSAMHRQETGVNIGPVCGMMLYHAMGGIITAMLLIDKTIGVENAIDYMNGLF